MLPWKRKQYVFAILALLSAVVLVYLYGTSPTHEGEWLPEQTALPEVQRVQDRYHIRNIRDFGYAADGAIQSIGYRDQDYSSDSLRRVWLGLSHFAGYGLAHSFLSFEFEDGRYLVASVEARMRTGQSYSPLAGLLRRYHKMIVLGTERDIIGRRSHSRGERVLLYPLELSVPQARHVFAGVMQDVRSLQEQPSFYNTLFDNCTTSLLRHDPNNRFWINLLDYRILLPGFADAYALQRGWIRADSSLAQLRRNVTVDNDIHPQEGNFSSRIRIRPEASRTIHAPSAEPLPAVRN